MINTYNKFDIDYVKNNKQYYINNVDDKIFCLMNISHLDKNNDFVLNHTNEFDEYSNEKAVNILQTNNTNDNTNIPMISETFKLPIQNINFVNNTGNIFCYSSEFVIGYGSYDAITNIQFLCSTSKYLVKKIILSKYTSNIVNYDRYEDLIEKYDELEIETTNYGYKILGLNNCFIIPTLTNTMIKIFILFETNQMVNEINEQDDFWIKYDNITMADKIRSILAQNYNDWVENCIVDICEYTYYYPNDSLLFNNILL